MVLIHHMPGWDDASKEMARKLAYKRVCHHLPNLHFREGKATPQENSASIREKGGMPDVRTMGDVEGAMAYLRTLPYLNGKVGLIGFCSGGRQTYLGACTLEGVNAAVDCWGGGVTQGTTSSPRHASLAGGLHRGAELSAAGPVSETKTPAHRPPTWTRRRRPSRSTARTMSSTAMTARDTASSP